MHGDNVRRPLNRRPLKSWASCGSLCNKGTCNQQAGLSLRTLHSVISGCPAWCRELHFFRQDGHSHRCGRGALASAGMGLVKLDPSGLRSHLAGGGSCGSYKILCHIRPLHRLGLRVSLRCEKTTYGVHWMRASDECRVAGSGSYDMFRCHLWSSPLLFGTSCNQVCST